MQIDLIEEARRQAKICNACRYCERYCSVFLSLHANRAFSNGGTTQLANLCHNSRGCYSACQYTAPHEFDLNLPQALAKGFQKNGMMIVPAIILCFALLFGVARWLGQSGGDGFYVVMSHNLMVAIFAPAFLLLLVCIGFSLWRY